MSLIEKTNESNFLESFFHKLSEANVEYSVLRNYESLPASLNGSDLDILIGRKDVNLFYNILDEIIKTLNAKIIIKFGQETPQICVCGYTSAWWGIQIDVFEGILPYKSVPIFDPDVILKRSKTHHSILVTDDDDGAILSLLKEILNNSHCSEKIFNDAKNAFTKHEQLYVEQINKHFNHNIGQLFKTTLSQNYHLENIKTLSHKAQGVKKSGVKNIIKIIKTQFQKISRFLSPPGFSIAILGSDGSGKTTIIDSITKPLSQSVHKAFYYEHMRPNLIPNIASLFGKKVTKEEIAAPQSSKPSGAIGSILRLSYYSFDYLAGYWLKVYPKMVKKSCIWVFDRYYYDYLIDPLRARINLPSWFIKSFLFFLPQPDLILCFGADPKIIYNRKPELSLEELTRQNVILRDIVSKNTKAKWMDSNCSIEEMVDKVMTEITNQMSDRYKNTKLSKQTNEGQTI
jgi:thymidylate kinase